jgi:hypothetical protein
MIFYERCLCRFMNEGQGSESGVDTWGLGVGKMDA